MIFKCSLIDGKIKNQLPVNVLNKELTVDKNFYKADIKDTMI